MTQQLDQAVQQKDAVSIDLTAERGRLVDDFLQENLYPLSVDYVLDYPGGTVTIVPQLGGERTVSDLKNYLRVQTIIDLPILDVIGFIGKGSPLNG